MAKGECNHCGQALDFDESMSGSEIPCPSCGTTIKLLIDEEVPPQIELASVTTSRSVSSNLISCRDCGKDVSPSASACPNCGCPISSSSPTTQTPPKAGVNTLICQYCGGDSVGRVRGLQGSEALIGILLLLCFVIPGVIYYIVIESKPYCSTCGRRV